MADVVDIPEFRAFYYTDDTPRQFYTLRRYEDESGSGKMHCYNIAPGIQLSFNDLNLSSCYQPLNVQKDLEEIFCENWQNPVKQRITPHFLTTSPSNYYEFTTKE